MKLYSYFTTAVFVLFVFTNPLHTKAEPPGQVSASVEIYELAQPQAFALQKVFTEGTDMERNNLLLNLRKGTSTNGIKTIAIGQRSCQLGQASQVNIIKEYRYPTQFDNRNGFATPTAFEVRNIGCMMALKVGLGEKEGSYSADTTIRNVVLNSTAHYSVSKADQRGSVEQPIFTTEEIKTQVQLTSGIPKLIGTYSPLKEEVTKSSPADDPTKSPFKNETTNNVLRLVFVTVQPVK